MKNYTALTPVSLHLNLHEHDKQKDTLSMIIHLVKKVQEDTCIYTKICIFRLEMFFRLNTKHEKKNKEMIARNNISFLRFF